MATPHDDDDDADHEAAVGVNHCAALIHEKQQMTDLQKNRQSFYFPDQIHTRVFRSLRMGHKLPFFVKYRPIHADLVKT